MFTCEPWTCVCGYPINDILIRNLSLGSVDESVNNCTKVFYFWQMGSIVTPVRQIAIA